MAARLLLYLKLSLFVYITFYLSHNSHFLFSLHLLLLPLTHMHWEGVGGWDCPIKEKN